MNNTPLKSLKSIRRRRKRDRTPITGRLAARGTTPRFSAFALAGSLR